MQIDIQVHDANWLFISPSIPDFGSNRRRAQKIRAEIVRWRPGL
jgi:hypothetical protein